LQVKNLADIFAVNILTEDINDPIMAHKIVAEATERYHRDPVRLMDILLTVQSELHYIPGELVPEIADALNISEADVEQTLSFYHFFSTEPIGTYTVYLNNSVVANMMGREKIVQAFEKEVGCSFGSVSDDGLIGLFHTSCIGMSDQEPAAIINGKVFPNLTSFRVREIVRDMRKGLKIEDMYANTFGDGKNSSPLLQSLVRNNIRRIGPILDLKYKPGKVLLKQIALMTPQDVIREVKISHLRGRGGAGFPTGLKWEFCRKATGEKKYIFCNADEGEPGTFKDRVILTEKPEMVFEGMTIAGYAIGAEKGILYLRYEYKYMEAYLEEVLKHQREKNLLGKNAAGIEGFHFDISIQFGAGAYVCGEESALIESAEGKRGEPRPRPPFPVEKGYLGFPTVVNNVETLCAVVKIIQNGGAWYQSMGTEESHGTKVLSISGDCKYPGIYELEWGFSVADILEMAGAERTAAVQVGGPSGTLVGPDMFDHILCYSDLATGGSLIIFNETRDLLREVVMNFTDFFIEESCGSCVPCRNIPKLLNRKLDKILQGRGTVKDLDEIEKWGEIMKINRCGLGHTAANPMLSSVRNFRHLYEEKIKRGVDYTSGFDLQEAIKESCEFLERIPEI
jgi:[NiFe] hydrogenase diaphorase moiety large subunit